MSSSNPLLVYTFEHSNRLAYIFDLMLKELLGLNYRFTHSKDELVSYEGPKFSYAREPIANELFFESVRLLFEENIYHQQIVFADYEGMKGLFPVLHKSSAVPFDMFASAFFMVTRYEEYLPSKMDKHSRFRGRQSYQYRMGILDRPEVNYYSLEIKRILEEKFPELKFTLPKFKYVPTIDVDMAYEYLYKGFRRNAGGLARSVLTSDFTDIKDRILVLAGRKQDPFDTYDFILKACNEYHLHPMFFFLISSGSRFDKNISYREPVFRELIKRIAAQVSVGIHLSYKSHVSSLASQREIDRLKDITGMPVTANRYHYLRFHIPHGLAKLVKLGITDEYSMGYAPRPGFRAAICTPHYFFNVKTNEVTPLVIHPLAFMDTTFVHYLRCEREEATEQMIAILKHGYKVGGTIIGLWHNSSFTEKREWKGWRKVFETINEEAAHLMESSGE
jgi:hypothetical protein